MIFLGNFILSFLVLHSQAENVSTAVQLTNILDDQIQNVKVFNVIPEIYQNQIPSKNSFEREIFSIIQDNVVVPKAFVPNRVNSQIGRQERAIDKLPPHKAFHEFHREPVRPRIPAQRRRTRPTRPTDAPVPRRFPEEDQPTTARRVKPSPSTRKRTRTQRPATTLRHPENDSQTKRGRPTPNSGIIRTTRPSVSMDVPNNEQRTTRGRSTRRPNISGKPLRTTATRRGMRKPTRPSGQFPPHKDFHDFHQEPIKPRLPGARRRTTVLPRITRLPDDAYHSVTPVPKPIILVKESPKPKLTTRYPGIRRISQKPSTVTSRSRTQSRLPDGRRVTQRRKTTLATRKKTIGFPDRIGPGSERSGDRSLTPTPRPAVTRRHTDRGHRRTKKPTSVPSEYARDATNSQTITQSIFHSSKLLPPHKAFHEFHFEPVQTKIPGSKTSLSFSEANTTPTYPAFDISSSRRPTRVTQQTKFSRERGKPTSSQRPRKQGTRFPNGKRITTAHQKQTSSGRRRITKPDILPETQSMDYKITTQSLRDSSTPRRRRPSKRPQKDFGVVQGASSPSPRRFPDETTRSATGVSKPIPPHKAFHEFHFEPVRPRIPGTKKTNGIPSGTSRPVFSSQYPSREFVTQTKVRPTPSSIPQNIWPRILDGDNGFVTQQPIFNKVTHLDTTRPVTMLRYTSQQKPGLTTRKQSTSSRHPGGKRRKPTTATKRPGTPHRIPEEEKGPLSTPQTPFQSSLDNRRKPTRRTQPSKTSRPSDKRISSVTARPFPPHKAFHDFHYDPVKPKIPGYGANAVSPFGTPKPASSPHYPENRGRTRIAHPTSTLKHGIQPRLPDGDQEATTTIPDLISGTEKPVTPPRRSNGRRRKPTSSSSTKRMDTQRRRPNGRSPVSMPVTQSEFPTRTSVAPPKYPIEDELKQTLGPQRQRTQTRFSSDHRTETTPGSPKPRTKPRFPGDRGSRPTASILPLTRKRPTSSTRTQKTGIPFDTGSTGKPIKIPSHKAFHEFHYAPVRPRYVAGAGA